MTIQVKDIVDLPKKKEVFALPFKNPMRDIENTGYNTAIEKISHLPISKDKVIGMVEFKREKLINVIKKVLKPSCSCNNGSGIVCVGCFYVKDIVNEIVSAKPDILTIKGDHNGRT